MPSYDGWSIEKKCSERFKELEGHILFLSRKVMMMEKIVEKLKPKEKKNAKSKQMRGAVS